MKGGQHPAWVYAAPTRNPNSLGGGAWFACRVVLVSHPEGQCQFLVCHPRSDWLDRDYTIGNSPRKVLVIVPGGERQVDHPRHRPRPMAAVGLSLPLGRRRFQCTFF